MSPIVELRQVTKAFHGVPALRDVSFDLLPGEVHALLGENGAGKSTLTKIIAGVHSPTQGEVFFNGDKQELIEEYRWFERISYRLSRTMHYLLPEERRQSRRRKARVE